MKTTLLFSAALFVATASFAQTNVNTNATVKGKSEIKANKVKTDADASSEANLQSHTIKEEHKTAEKSSVSATANEKGKQVSGIASGKQDGSVQGKEKGKLISSVASDGKSESGSVHSDAKGSASANVNTNGHVKTNVKKVTHAAKKIKASSANTIHTSAAATHAVKVPVTVKTNAGVGIKIK
ncbi:MAG: hypothetical protein ACTHKY_19465 [Ginsengibacter sp.]